MYFVTFWGLMRGGFFFHWLQMYLSLNHIQCPFYVFKCICISLFVDLFCTFFHTFHIADFLFTLEWISKKSGLGTCLKSLNNFLNDPASMDVIGQALHKYICLLVLECYYVIRLVGIKQIPSFLLSYNRLKVSFSPLGGLGNLNLAWMGWGIWTRTVKSFLQNRHVLFFSMEVFKGMKFSKVQMLEELSGGAGGMLKL